MKGVEGYTLKTDGGGMMLSEQIRCHFLSRFCFLAAIVGFLTVGTNAGMYSPSWQWGIVENNSGKYGTYASQLSVDVTPFGSMVDFTFSNVGPNPCSMTGIYIEDGTLLGLASVIAQDSFADDPSRDGIVLGQPAHPSNMPGWSTLDPKFYSSSAFSVSSNGAPDGVSPGESVVLRYALLSGKTITDVLNAIHVGFDPATYYVGGIWTQDHIRIGLHVQDIGQESDSLILTPVPGAALLGMIGLSAVGIKLRKRA